MPEKTPVADWITWRMDVDAGQSEILALEQKEENIAQSIAVAFFCSVGSAKKFGDHVALGYRVTCYRTGKQFWMWGADRQMKDGEIEAFFRRQIETNLVADC